MLPPYPQRSVAHSTREGPRVKQKIVQSAEKAFIALNRLVSVGLWRMAYSVWFVCSNYMP